MKVEDAVEALGALAQATRLAIFRLLVQAGPGGLAAGAVAQQLELAAPTLSFHLKELAHAGLVDAREQGRFVFYTANYTRMAELLSFLTSNCCRGMPQECFATIESAMIGCCKPAARPQRKEKTR